MDGPIFLDDVVVSLDRNHRGMVAEILNEEFSGRRVIVLTHDREWYTELKHQLPESQWRFKTLLPWQDPLVGIRWSTKSTTFDEARAYLESRPDSAGNDARKIMDVELALVAEKLPLNLLYLRGDKNDHRTAYTVRPPLEASRRISNQLRQEVCILRIRGADWYLAWSCTEGSAKEQEERGHGMRVMFDVTMKDAHHAPRQA
jgi:hypothetical protein